MKEFQPFDLTNLSIKELSKLIKSQKVSPVELVDTCLKKIEKLNPSLNAFITVTSEMALQEAERAEAEVKSGNWKGPLHGIPIGIKDIFDTAGIKTTAAFEHFNRRIPEQDAEIVRQLKNAGAIIIGKTNMHRLAMGTTSVVSFYGSVHNPWNQDYIAGGSSGGSAAAVAAVLCLATIDTDAIGSCRLPASCCGVTGFKPTNGLLSQKGILAGEKTEEAIIKLASTSLMTGTAEDAAILLKALIDPVKASSEYDLSDDFIEKSTQNLKIGIIRNFKAAEEVRENFLQVIETVKKLELKTFELEIPFEAASFNIEKIEEDRKNVNQLIFSQADILVLPTVTETTPTIAEAQKRENSNQGKGVAFSADNTFFCNYFGLPAISIPGGFSKNGLPLGLQIVGPRGGENRVLEAANRFQNVFKWSDNRSAILS